MCSPPQPAHRSAAAARVFASSASLRRDSAAAASSSSRPSRALVAVTCADRSACGRRGPCVAREVSPASRRRKPDCGCPWPHLLRGAERRPQHPEGSPSAQCRAPAAPRPPLCAPPRAAPPVRCARRSPPPAPRGRRPALSSAARGRAWGSGLGARDSACMPSPPLSLLVADMCACGRARVPCMQAPTHADESPQGRQSVAAGAPQLALPRGALLGHAPRLVQLPRELGDVALKLGGHRAPCAARARARV
jgi:hypothetical protein